jgi:hypothetical protein
VSAESEIDAQLLIGSVLSPDCRSGMMLSRQTEVSVGTTLARLATVAVTAAAGPAMGGCGFRRSPRTGISGLANGRCPCQTSARKTGAHRKYVIPPAGRLCFLDALPS